EMEKPGYKVATTQVVSEYDWFWGQVTCGPCEAVGALPTYEEDLKDRNIGVRVAEAVFYEYPRGFFRAWGRGLRIFSPDPLLGSPYKLKQKDSGYWEGWHGLGTPDITANLEPK